LAMASGHAMVVPDYSLAALPMMGPPMALAI
jgi:hypothetical protein